MAAREPVVETAEVVAVTLEGDGILASEGKRVLVPGALAGERIRYQRHRRHRNYDQGRLLDIENPAPARVTPRCPSFGTCGGCSLQHLDAEGQRALKETALRDALTRIGRVEPERYLPPLFRAPWGYRRRARLAVRHVPRKGRVLVGFREREKPYVADMAGCDTLQPGLARLLTPLSTLIGRLSLRARLPQVEMTAADNATALVFRVLDEPTAGDLEQFRQFGREHQVQIWLQPGGTDTVAPLEPTDAGDLWYELPEDGLRLGFGPVDFIQVNGEVNRLMVRQALALLAPQPGERVLDLYCGIGNFSLPLARRAGTVLGIEGAAAAVEHARRNAERNGLQNAEFVVGDLSGAATEGAWTRQRFDAVLLDPPRTGAREVLAAMAGTGARRVLYVSCHPGTLARDAGILVQEHGYRLETAGIVDMFPQTSHVESMAFFVRGEP